MSEKPRTRCLSEPLNNGMRLVIVSKEKFSKVSVVLDGHLFEDCEFDDCQMCWFGGPVRIRGRMDVRDPEWIIQGAGLPAIECFANLCRVSEPFRMQWIGDLIPPKARA
jgi:hypothetical protein